MDLATLQALKPSEFENAADRYRATAAMADAAKDTVDNQISAGIRNQLKGATATAALRELAAVSGNFQYVQTECGLVSTALNGFAFDMASAKRKLEAAIEDARADHCTVHADGSVGYPAGRKPGEDKDTAGGTVTGSAGSDPTADALERQAANIHPNPYYGVAIEYADRIADALREATEADAKWEPKLRALRADDDLVVSDRDWTDVTSDRGGVTDAAGTYLDSIKPPPREATPEESAAWWKGLTPEQQADYLAVHPNAIGAMNGLPSDIRDDANRMVLDETRAQYQLDLNTIPKEPVKYAPNTNGSYPAAVITAEWRQWNDKYGAKKDRLEGALKGMQAIQDRFDRTGEKGLPEAYLLGFDPTGLGDGRIILANGNPDTADHVGVWVPGTKASLESSGGDLGRAEKLWAESHRMARGKDVSTILWLDYNAPDNVLPQATRGEYAVEGGPRLHDFLEGNRVAQQAADGTRSHTTVLGHSYGSTVVGVSAQSGSWQDLKAADDYVFAGSPGVQADHAGDLGVRGNHVWAMGADSWDDDMVREGGRFMGLGDNLAIPTDKSFGGMIMKSDASGHTGFYDEDSISLRNQAAVIVGAYGKVKLE
ncbi:Alpha/beta hydrolase [Streptomyces sp. 2131.1]|uniref:alpha/beta hydrolase n=1 Tax=Streptomyces sp. 2131.1 TaxID=1855346 RepID=UPI0008977DD3|nr:alpha/beta hydrolase [Streptomyces sp. 2131.1]SED94292.1 Alpha/beta hydrolase [Streptomyces sp. 2131.1]